MSLTASDMQRLERDARGIAKHSLSYIADAQRCLRDTRDPIAGLALLSALWSSGHAIRDNQKAGLEDAGQWLADRIRRDITIPPERLALELGWLHRLVTTHGESGDDRGAADRTRRQHPGVRRAPFGEHLDQLRDRRANALARAEAAPAVHQATGGSAGPSMAPRPRCLPDAFEVRFASWQLARAAFKRARDRRKQGKVIKDRLLDVIPVVAELQHLAADLACSVLHTDGMLALVDHTDDLPTFWIAVADLALREGKRVPARIFFAPSITSENSR